MNYIAKNLADCSSNEGFMIIKAVETEVDAKKDVANEDIDEESKCMDKVCFLPITGNAEMNESDENEYCRYSKSNRIEYSCKI